MAENISGRPAPIDSILCCVFSKNMNSWKNFIQHCDKNSNKND